ncbi:MAG: hypothetical protein ACC642_10925, partial [Pseudomonadales bacterium]
SAEPVFIEGEQLLAQPPGGWRQTFATTTRTLRMSQFVPENEDEEHLTHKISFESMASQPLPYPIEFIDLISGDKERACTDFEGFGTFSGFENGYPTSVHLLICPKNKETKKSEVSMIKVIRGNDYFYTITSARQGAPLDKGVAPLSETVVAAWSIYLRSIGVCDTTRPEHPCPVSGFPVE